MATIIQHGTAPFWGVQASITGVYLENLEFSNSITSSKLKNQQGKVVGVTEYDQEMTFSGSGTVLLGSGGTQNTRVLPDSLAGQIGEAVTVLTPPSGLVNCELAGSSTATAIMGQIGWTEGNESAVSANVSGEIYYW